MFQPSFPTDDLRGAEYNPRAIASDALERLQASITTIGFAKPIIVTQAGLIVVGHQRTKASRALKRPNVPAWVLKDISVYDEVRFNQLHNGTDLDDIDHPVRVPCSIALGFADVPGEQVNGNLRSVGAVIRKEICELLAKYGNWGGAVATQDGLVLSGQQYALCCKLLDMPCRTFYVPNAKAQEARDFFMARYGEFSYGHLPKTTWLQTFAQMMRLRNEDDPDKKDNASTLYKTLAIPRLTKEMRILDFGCGQGDYVRSLRSKGYQIQGMEFFYRKGNSLDPAAVHKMADDLCRSLRLDGLFDVVVCDSVLNSTDSLQAERDVMACCNAFTKPGGMVFLSGRRMDRVESQLRHTQQKAGGRQVEFVDQDGFTALFRKGAWFYQKFHTQAQAEALMAEWIGPCLIYQNGQTTSFQMAAKKTKELPADLLEGAIMREFNLPWPEGKTVGKGEKVWETFKQLAARGDQA